MHIPWRRGCAILVLAWCAGGAVAQPADPDEARLVAALRAAEQSAGAQSAELIGPLEELQGLYRERGRLGDTLPLAQRQLDIAERALAPDDPRVAAALNNLAERQREFGQLPQALATHQRSLALHEKIYGAEHVEVAVAANNLGLVYHMMGRLPEALALYQRSLAIREKVLPPDSLDIANSLNSLAEFYRQVGPQAQAVPLYERSLAIAEKQLGPDHPITALILGSLAGVQTQLGRLDLALAAAQRSVAIREKVMGPAHPQLALGLNLLAEVYRGLGDDAKTLPLLERSLAMYEATLGPEHPDVAMGLNNLGGFHESHGRPAQALPLYERSLAIVEKQLGPEHPYVASSLNNIGALLLATGQLERAEQVQRRSLAIRERQFGPDHPEVAVGVHNLGVTLDKRGDHAGAAVLLRRAVTIASASPAAGEVLWSSQSDLSRLYAEQVQPDLAIVWGKEAVNTLQGLRAQLSGLDQGLQSSYLQSKRSAYDHLADLLIAQGRIAEAQEVLQMLKEQELHDSLVRAETVDPRSTRIELTGLERSRFARYYELRDRQAELGAERQALQRKARSTALSPAEAARLKEIVEQLMPVAAQAMQAFFDQLERDMAALAPPGGLPAGQEASRLRKAVDALALSEPAAAAVGVQYLVTDQRLSIVLTLPGTPPIAYQRPVGRRQLYAAIARALLQLKNPATQPELYRAALRDLHGWLIEPVTADLQRFGARTLMLSLDDQLRLIPFAALLDERGHYVVQDYTVALYNEAARQALDKPGAPGWRVAAMGLSEAVDDLPALRAVPEEIQAVVKGRGISGDAWLNRAFDRPRLVSALGEPGKGAYNVLHVASHFVFQPGLPAQSRLYLGDKSRLTLADIARDDLRFGNFELVTFSACETATGGGRDANGQEMESLSAKTQNQGAQAVLATLWKVDDRSTGPFMQRFYALRAEQGLNKAAALRAVQLAMIEGRLRAPPAQDWRAPAHWAPFVLMGNWR